MEHREMENIDIDEIVRLAKALAVEATDANPVLPPDERMKLLEGACSMRKGLELLIKQLADPAVTGDDHSSRSRNSVETESKIVEVRSATVGIKSASEPGKLNYCQHGCGCMDPALWSTLPTELLQMVFARLPFPQMCQNLQLLCKNWEQSVTDGASAFTKSLSEANPKILEMGFHSCEGRGSVFYGTYLYDFHTNIWHFFRLFLEINPARRYHIKCASGGLVCYVTPDAQDSPVSIFVCNPLTKRCRELPSHPLSHIVPSMVQLVVNRDSKCYRVVLVVDRNFGRVSIGGVREAHNVGLRLCYRGVE